VSVQRRLFFKLSALVFLACGPPTDEDLVVSSSRRGIVGGVLRQGDPAVVAIATVTTAGDVFQQCNATLIGRVTLLTTATCAELGTIYGFFGDELPRRHDSTRLFEIKQKLTYPSWRAAPGRDLALMRLPAPVSVTPVPLFQGTLTQNDLGRPLRHVGFGDADLNNPVDEGEGFKRTVTVPVRYLGDDLEAGLALQGTCFGDSGAPGFLTVAGVEQVAAVSYDGDDDCAQRYYSTRVDRHASWIVQQMAPWEAAVPAAMPPDAGAPAGTPAQPTQPSTPGESLPRDPGWEALDGGARDLPTAQSPADSPAVLERHVKGLSCAAGPGPFSWLLTAILLAIRHRRRM
jgi:hypothetical protein